MLQLHSIQYERQSVYRRHISHTIWKTIASNLLIKLLVFLPEFICLNMNYLFSFPNSTRNYHVYIKINTKNRNSIDTSVFITICQKLYKKSSSQTKHKNFIQSQSEPLKIKVTLSQGSNSNSSQFQPKGGFHPVGCECHWQLITVYCLTVFGAVDRCCQK